MRLFPQPLKTGLLLATLVGLSSVSHAADVLSIGFCKAEFFTGIDGTAVNLLTATDKFLNNLPDETRFVVGINSPNGYGDNYGARLTGFFIPDETADYDFFIGSDDASQFFLSTDENPPDPLTAAPTCEETACCNAFTEPPSPRTTAAPISLVAGQKYAFVALVKEGGGGDYLQVAFRKVGDPTAAASLKPIGGKNLAVNTPENGAVITFTTQPKSADVVEGRPATLTVAASANSPTDGALVVGYQWQKDGTDIPGATSASYRTPRLTAADSGGKYSVSVFTLGAQAKSDEAVLTIVADKFPPQIVSAGSLKNFNSDSTQVGVIFDEPLTKDVAETASNYTLSSGAVTAASLIENSSGVDGLEQGVLLTVTGVTPGTTYTVTAKNISDILGNTIAAPISTTFKAGALNWIQIGRPNGFAPGAFSISDDSFNLVSGGQAFWDVNDDITMIYQEIDGDFDKIAQVEYSDPASNWARSGISARESLNGGLPTTGPSGDNPASRYQMVISDPDIKFDGTAGNNQYETNRRLTTGAATTSAAGGDHPGYPNSWVRLKRVADHFSMFFSHDGTAWNNIDTTDFTTADPTVTPQLSSTLFVGPTYGSENGNIGDVTLQRQWATRIRHYGDAYAQKPRGKAAYSIGLKLGASEQGSQVSASDVAGVDYVAQGNWNNLYGASALGDVAVTGIVAEKAGQPAATTVTIEFESANTWVSDGIGGRGEHNNKFKGADFNLMSGYLDSGDSTTTQVTLTGLPTDLTAGTGYDVYLYFLGGVGAGRGGGYRILDDQSNVLKDFILAQANDNPSSYTEVTEAPGSTTYGVGNYLVFRGLTSPNIRIEASTANGLGTGGTKRCPLNNIQIVSPSGLTGGGGDKPTISIANADGVKITFTGTLTGSDNVDGPYTPVAGATSPFSVTQPGAHKFYRSQQ